MDGNGGFGLEFQLAGSVIAVGNRTAPKNGAESY